MGRQLFWFTVLPKEETEPGTDLWAFSHGYVSMTPLSLDLTDAAELERLSSAVPMDVPPHPAEPATEEAAEDE